MEINEKHPLSRLLSVNITLEHNTSTQQLQVALDYTLNTKFKNVSYLDGYRIGVIGIFPELTNQKAITTSAYSPVIAMKHEGEPLLLSLSIPPTATAFLLCLKIEGWEQQKVSSGALTKGMRIVTAGRFSPFIFSS